MAHNLATTNGKDSDDVHVRSPVASTRNETQRTATLGKPSRLPGLNYGLISSHWPPRKERRSHSERVSFDPITATCSESSATAISRCRTTGFRVPGRDRRRRGTPYHAAGALGKANKYGGWPSPFADSREGERRRSGQVPVAQQTPTTAARPAGLLHTDSSRLPEHAQPS